MESSSSGHDGAPGVLIIDSEELVRSFLQLALRDLGLIVYSFSSFDHILREPLPTGIRLVILDLAHGTGDVAALKQHFPHSDYLLMSGGLEEAQQTELKRQGIHAILEKPFPLSRLVEQLRQLRLC